MVDDDHAVLTALEMLLEDWGMHVVCAGAFDEVAEILSRGLVSSLDLVLTDYRLPNGATGAQVIELVRSPRSQWHRRSGDDRRYVPERLIEAQKVECRLLHKPVNPEDLKRALIACF